MQQYLRSYMFYQQADWDTILSMAEFSAFNQVSKTTGTTPFLANYGYHPSLDFATTPDTITSTIMATAEGAEIIEKLHNHMQAKMSYVPNTQKQFAHTSCTPVRKLAIGDQVSLKPASALRPV